MKVKIGFIGAGGWRAKLGDYAKNIEDVEIIGAMDPCRKTLEEFNDYYGGVKFLTEDYQELLKRDDINTVFIISPDYCHYEQTIAALRAGKHVFLEKPMGITVEECDEILKVAMETGKKLFLGHNMRYFDSILKMKELIDKGDIGEVQSIWCRHFVSYGGDAYYKDWHSEREKITGLLLQKGAHDIDVIHWLAGGYTEKVVGMGKLSVYNRCEKNRQLEGEIRKVSFNKEFWPPLNQEGLSKKIDVEDHSMIMMQLDNGVQASYLQSHYTPDSVRNYTIIGTKGRIENIGDHGKCEIHLFNTRTDSYGEPDAIYKLREKLGTHGGSDPEIIKSFINFVKYGTPVNTSPVAARNAVAVGYYGTLSLRNDICVREIPKLSQEIIEYFENNQTKI